MFKKQQLNNIDLTELNKDTIKSELKNLNTKKQYISILISTILLVLIIIATSLLVAMFIMPVFQIYGSTMSPTLNEGNFVVSVKNSDIKNNDIIAFYSDNKLLVKRVIATSGDIVKIDSKGYIFVNDQKLDNICDEDNFSIESDIKYPYKVPENSYFVISDDLTVSVDSRNSLIGCVSKDQIIGKVIFKIWPIKDFGLI